MFSLGAGISVFRDQLSLQSAELYFKQLQTIVFFVDNVPLKGSSYRDYNEVGFNRTKSMFEKAVQQYGIKILAPLRTLLLRVLNQNLGYIELHVLFLALCNNFQVPKLAITMLERCAMFRHISRKKIAQFLIEGCNIYIKLGQYSKAYELIQRGKNLEFLDTMETLNLNSRIVVLALSTGNQIQSEVTDRLKLLNFKIENSTITNISQLAKLELTFKVEFYLSLKTYRQLAEPQKLVLKKDGLLQVYQSVKYVSLKKYICQEIRQNNWRIKAQSIKDKPLANMEIITGINKNQQLYRYDCKNKIMYFNHKESDQEKLNSLITLAMNMSEEVSSYKIERKERDTSGGRSFKMGGFGSSGFGGRIQMQLMRRMS